MDIVATYDTISASPLLPTAQRHYAVGCLLAEIRVGVIESGIRIIFFKILYFA